jgi:hypothetical protein
MSEPHIIAEVREYSEFTAALRAWIVELGTNYECVGGLAGLPDRYLAKLISATPVRNFSRVSLGATLGALCLKLLVAVDAERLEAMQPRYTVRSIMGRRADDDMPRRKPHHLRGNSQYMRILRQKGVLILSRQRRQQIARHAAAVRWRSDASSALNQIAARRSICPNTGEHMRKNLKLTVVVGPELHRLIDAGAERQRRSRSNYAGLLLDRAVREDAAQVEQPPSFDSGVEQQPTAA